jgi:predicted RNase H-like nuclease (RuvC/YqgF family)
MMNTLLQWIGAAVVGALATIAVAWINRGPALQQAVNARVDGLLKGYEQTVRDLRGEVTRLEAKLSETLVSLERAQHENHELRMSVEALRREIMRGLTDP